ncbi:MAG: IS1 family transposase [SAR324 cluster bacterium]|nr:IS1 family transposase [SAR324 cluster bacterium]
MVLKPVPCPACEDTQNVVKRGKSKEGKQRYLCQNPMCSTKTFILDYSDKGRLPEVKRQMVDICVHGSGIRDTARVSP